MAQQEWKASTDTTRYDQERVERLRPIETAIKQLGLSLDRARKLLVVLSALEVQIETGGDSPEVNQLLIEALRAGLRHQVDGRQAQGVLRALATFEQTEAQRWEQVRNGTLPPIALSPEDQLGELIQAGYTLLQARRITDACDRWLQAWELVKQIWEPKLRTTEAFDAAHPSGLQSVFNWCQDLEMELGNAAVDDPSYHQHRLRYAREFLAHFPDVDRLFLINFTRAEGEALAHLDRRAEADAVFAALVERLPDEAWAYIHWSDLYWLFRDLPHDYDRAELILRQALARPRLKERTSVLQRLEEVRQEKHEAAAEPGTAQGAQPQQAAPSAATAVKPAKPAPAAARMSNQPAPPARRPGRNDPCWCGSGLKYKRCHLPADEAAQRRR